jgi:hypothetical protein
MDAAEDDMLNRSIVCALLGFVCVIAFDRSLALADTSAPPTTAPSTDRIIVPKGLRTFETYGSFAAQPKGQRAQLYSGMVGVGYYFMNNNSLSLEVSGLQGTQAGPDVWATGYNFLLRTHVVTRPGWTSFIDFGPGILESDHRLPQGGTDFNFFFKTGVGAEVHLCDKTDLLFGTRYMHISNARIEGSARNPSLNTIQGYMGLLFKW